MGSNVINERSEYKYYLICSVGSLYYYSNTVDLVYIFIKYLVNIFTKSDWNSVYIINVVVLGCACLVIGIAFVFGTDTLHAW